MELPPLAVVKMPPTPPATTPDAEPMAILPLVRKAPTVVAPLPNAIAPLPAAVLLAPTTWLP